MKYSLLNMKIYYRLNIGILGKKSLKYLDKVLKKLYNGNNIYN